MKLNEMKWNKMKYLYSLKMAAKQPIFISCHFDK